MISWARKSRSYGLRRASCGDGMACGVEHLAQQLIQPGNAGVHAEFGPQAGQVRHRPWCGSSAGSRAIWVRAAASASGASSDRRPWVPLVMNSGIAETGVDRIGSPWEAASISTLGRPSRSPSSAMREGRTNRSAAAHGVNHLGLVASPAPGNAVCDTVIFGHALQAGLSTRRRQYGSSASPDRQAAGQRRRSAGQSPSFSTSRPTDII